MEGDGSCADGAIVQAVEQSDYLDSLPLSQCLRPHARSTATFRQREVGAAMAEWTADDWASKVPMTCRDEEWQERNRTAGGAGPLRSPAGELAFFRHVLGLPTHAVGRAYLHVAAGALQQGILLLTTNHRHRPAAQQLDDFGTEQYDSSIVLFFSVGPLKPGSRGDGHYETVCLSSADEDVVHTVFERHHPLLCSLRAWAASHADERTLDHERMQHLCFPAISMRPGEQFSGPLAPAAAAGSSLEVRDSAQSGTRPRRSRILPARLRGDACGGDSRADRAGRPGRPAAARSLSAVLVGAASTAPGADSQPSPPRARTRVSSSATAARAAPAVAASRAPCSARPVVLGELARRNLQAWVRERSGRGRLASRVHLSAVPLFFVCAGIARKTGRFLSMEQLTQDEASANEGNRHTTSQPTDCSIPSSSLPTSFPACSVRPHSVHRGDHGAASSSYSSSLPSSSSSSCSSSLSPSLSVVSMPLSSSSCSTTAFCFALAACCASAACSARS